MSAKAGNVRAAVDVATLAERSIAAGSQSFASAARLFDPATRRSAVMLYAWCRHCDDVIDDQHLGHSIDRRSSIAAELRLRRLEELTRRAFAGEPLTEPSFLALQEVARLNDLPLQLALDHLAGFRMDVEERRYGTIEDTLSYCHHVAGVVGVMMAIVMGARTPETLHRAADLGIAFQLTNIARDIVPDAVVGRVYLPDSWLQDTGLRQDAIVDPARRAEVAVLARRLVAEAEPFYASARIGIDALPRRSALAVATALGVYREIGLRVVERGPQAWDERVSTSKADKARHMLRAGGVALRWRRSQAEARCSRLWRHGAAPFTDA